ncbi:MAG TPA: DNA polymerase III subunit gamma/tau [Pyrinomonadaceae bacterium]|nr:DNA polymerase III subunit gamma/tau [Pyrinomonadaceae bacterium]
MSYQVIARKWRPQSFDEVTGQEVVTHSLRNAIEHDRLHHAYLFSGARGVGKTTTARLLAKALNCHRYEGKTTTPCRIDDEDACPSCIEIAESRSLDVLEIDAASHTGIDNVRETIIDGLNINPARDRYKVFIIDEVHQLSKPAFNALLKSLEEPPPNVVFIMATTELHKVPITITSRCQEFQFRTIANAKIYDRLKLIAEKDGIDVSDEALREIARSGMGSMRDAQSNFDQVISFSGEKIDAASVAKALGSAGADVLEKIVVSVANSDAKTILETVDDLVSRGHELRNFASDLLGLFRDLMVQKVAGTSTERLVDSAAFPPEKLTELAAPFAESDLLRFFHSLCETESSLREAAQPRYVLEVGLVKLVEMKKLAPIEDILKKLGSPAPNAAVASAGEEKKTLKSENAIVPKEASAQKAVVPIEPLPSPITPAPEPSFEAAVADNDDDFVVEPPSDDIGFADEEVYIPLKDIGVPVVPRTNGGNLTLSSIPADLLVHFDDVKLDDAYDDALRREGDDLLPVASGVELAEGLSTRARDTSNGSRSHSAGGGTAARTAVDLSHMIPQDIEAEASQAIPALSADPSEEELMAFANSLPLVRLAKQVFRATVVEARKRD